MKVLTKGLIELESPHLQGTLSHFFPPARETIFQLEERLAEFGLIMPTFSQKISIDYDAYVLDRNNRYSRELRKLNNSGVGYVRTAVLYDKEGMYAVDLDFIADLPALDIGVLKARLDGEKIRGVQLSKDKKLAFAPFETIIYGEQEHGDLARNGGVMVLARDKSQVEKLVSISEIFGYKPIFCALRIQDLRIQEGVERRFVRLGSLWIGSGLNVDGCCCCRGGAGGFASGVKRTGEASS